MYLPISSFTVNRRSLIAKSQKAFILRRELINVRQKGFTLIELLVVIGILAILLAIVLVAINPARQFAQANNTQRSSNVNSVLNAVHQFAADNNGTSPAGIDTNVKTIMAPVTDATTQVDLCADLVPTYIADLPLDPTGGTESPAASVCTDVGAEYNTGYTIVTSATDNRVTVAAPDAELSEVITVTR